MSKKFMENMEADEKTLSENSVTTTEEDFSWAINNGNENIKNLYVLFPFEEWKIKLNADFNEKNIIEGPRYQEDVCKIFKEYIFKNEKFISEKLDKEIFKDYTDDNKELSSLNKEIHPDFIVDKMDKKKFLELFEKRNYMFRKSKHFNIPEEYKNVIIIGEIKQNPDLMKVKKKQRQNYIDFRDAQNKNQKNNYFVVMYICDVSYKGFWEKTFHEKDNIVIGYVPKLYKRDHLEVQEKLKAKSFFIIKNIDSFSIVNKKDDNIIGELENDLNNLIKETGTAFYNLLSSNKNKEKKFHEGKDIKELYSLFEQTKNSIQQDKLSMEVVNKTEDNFIMLKRKRNKEKFLEKNIKIIKNYTTLLKELTDN